MLNNKSRIAVIAAAAAVILFFTVFNSIKLVKMSEALGANQQLTLNESAVSRETNDYLNNLSSMLAYDLNRTRASLGLSATNYPFRSLDDEAKNSPQTPEPSAYGEMFDAVGVLIQAETDNRKSAMLGRFFRNETIQEVIDSTGTYLEKLNNTLFSLKYNGTEYLTAAAVSENEIHLAALSGDELNIHSASNEAAYFIRSSYEELMSVNKKKNEFSRKLNTLADRDLTPSEDLKTVISDDGLTITNIYNSSAIKGWVNTEGASVSYRISTGKADYQDFNDFKTEIIKQIKAMDLRTDDEILLDNAKHDLEKKLQSREFTEYLERMNLSVSTLPRDDLDYYYYDINYGDGKRLGSFSILKKLGEVYLVDADEVPVSSLKTLKVQKELSKPSLNRLVIPENIPEIDSLYSQKDTLTFLLVGNHEKNTDTMILVHADKRTGKAYMIGIPRDLYWKGRKINSIYLYYGAEQLKKELSEITGLEITNYIIVDMYAFIDIVNILDGIEVTLEEDLVDPSYRIRENGEWSTLNYSRGTYNMNGIEALRVARSRHGSNDFERSKRQQQIIESLLNRILELKLTDADKVYSMIQAMFEYTDTDFSLLELMSIYNNYSEIELAGKHVLSFDNILYDTYSNVYMLDNPDIELDPDFNKGAWILFPRENNWNNIRWYIRQIISGEL